MAETSISQYGSYNTPQSFDGSAATTFILGQWWYDFDRLTGLAIPAFAAVEAKSNGGGTAKFGIFLLPDGDVNIADLFSILIPDFTVAVANVNAFHKYSVLIDITRPLGKKQVLLAAQPQNAGTIISWRSILMKFGSA